MRKIQIVIITLFFLILFSFLLVVAVNSTEKLTPIIIGIISLAIYIRFLFPYLKEAIVRRKKEAEQRLKAAEDEKLRKIMAEANEKVQRLTAMREEELRPFLKSNQRLWQCINCECSMTDEQRMKYGVCPTCKGDTWVKTHTDKQILYFVLDEFPPLDKPLPSDINIKEIEAKLARHIKQEKEARKEKSLRSQEDLLRQQSYLLREQNEETKRLREVEEEKLALEEEQLRELREKNRHD